MVMRSDASSHFSAMFGSQRLVNLARYAKAQLWLRLIAFRLSVN
jgi:hypothetical protein